MFSRVKGNGLNYSLHESLNYQIMLSLTFKYWSCQANPINTTGESQPYSSQRVYHCAKQRAMR